MIAEHKPRYNRRSRFPEQAPWVKMTVEPFPRLSVVRAVAADRALGAEYLGPFASRRAAEQAVAALHEAFALRQCSGRLPLRPSPSASACVLAEIDRCGAPCTGQQSPAEYAALVAAVRAAIRQDARPVANVVLARVAALSAGERFEEAATHRDRLVAFVRGASRTQRLAPIAASPELVAARRAPEGGWELVLVRHGRLAGATTSPPRADPVPFIKALRDSGEVVEAPAPPAPAAHPEETEKILYWLEQPGVRLVSLDGEWSCPVGGAGGLRARLDPVQASRSRVAGFGHPAVTAALRPR
jgi:DNA polymerase-3 subunit epsilon